MRRLFFSPVSTSKSVWLKRILIILVIISSLLSATQLKAAQSGKIIGWGEQIVGADLSSGFVAVSAGWEHSLGLKADG